MSNKSNHLSNTWVPLSVINLRNKDFSNLIDKVKQRIEVWETKMLSIAVRIELDPPYPILDVMLYNPSGNHQSYQAYVFKLLVARQM